MPAVTQKAGAGKLSIGATTGLTQFNSQVTSCTLTPSASVGDPIAVLSGETVAGAFTEAWELEVTFNTDLGQTKSVWEYLFNNAGTTQPFEYEPTTAAGKKFTGSLIVTSAPLGGDVTEIMQSDATFTVIGKPVMTAVV
ncbi:hypothetical protein [Arthrobacter sp. BF1]|uniref:hypothetical protein n=1 Tax=Arthrobacter sp. BF1 TaxID=2821145 RepID=UPI001C4E79A3|nr:hypothetical protein [Arthrobacter sp. BF1]